MKIKPPAASGRRCNYMVKLNFMTAKGREKMLLWLNLWKEVGKGFRAFRRGEMLGAKIVKICRNLTTFFGLSCGLGRRFSLPVTLNRTECL